MDDGYDFTTSGNLKRVQKLRDERDEERQENGRLRAKVAKLERENARLKERSLPFSMPRIEPFIPKTAYMRVFPEETLKSIQQAQANFEIELRSQLRCRVSNRIPASFQRLPI